MLYDSRMEYRNFIIYRVVSRSVASTGGCLEYQPGLLKHKYGLVSVTFNGKRKSVPAHRAVWMATHGCFDLPPSVYICHRCDNPRCVNIEHLFAGTPSDNARDKISKGRNASTYAKHTRLRVHGAEVVEAIRNAKGRYIDIAAQYGVSVGYVSKIRTGKLKAT